MTITTVRTPPMGPIDPLPSGGVESVFGRIGVVVAAFGDYLASQIENDSGVPGLAVSDALDLLDTTISALQAYVAAIAASQVDNDSTVPGLKVSDALDTLAGSVGAVLSVFGRMGAVVAALGDYTTSQVTNASTVAGATDTAALDTLKASIAALVTGVSSVFGRSGAVVAVSGDYTTTQVTNASTVAGATATAALDTLKASIAAGVLSVFGRVGAVVAVSGDYTTSLVTNASTVTGATATAALDTLKASIAALVTGVSSVFGRSGAVVSAAGDYTTTQITNASTVAGATDTAALDTLKASIAALVTGVSSVFTRTGAVVAVSGDYTTSQVTNSSTVAGATATAALDTLSASIAGLVTGVSSVFTRTGAVVAVSGDYTSTLVTNVSSVAGASVTAALNALLALILPQVIWWGATTGGSSTGAVFPFKGYGQAAMSNTEAKSRYVFRRAASLNNLCYQLDVAYSSNATATIRKNGTNTALTATITAGALFGQGSGAVSVAAGDIISVQSVTGSSEAGATTNPQMSVEITWL